MDNIARFYEGYDEEGRLSRDKAHLVEYLITIRYLDRLVQPGGRVLDSCAGAGRYSFYLADKGMRVTACDLVEHNVNIIKANPKAKILEEISVCNALDLSRFDKNSFDIVLCMGALYHVASDDLKEKAISESVRVCKPGGVIVLAYLSANKSEHAEQVNQLHHHPSGIFYNTAPYEIEDIAEKYKLEKIYHVSTRSSTHFEDNINDLSNDHFQKYIEQLYMSCEDEGAAEQLTLWIGRKAES